MTSTTLPIYISAVLIFTDLAASQGISSLISRLYNSAAQNQKPLILIIDKTDGLEESKIPLKPNNFLDTSLESEEDSQPAVYLIQSKPSKPDQHLPPFHEVGHNFHGLHYRPRGHFQHHKYSKGHMKFIRSTPSPILKKLLRFKNEINCEANDECNNRCKNRFDGKKRENCKAKCEIKYECFPEPETDPCPENDSDCELDDDKNPSTKGVILVTEKPECPRC